MSDIEDIKIIEMKIFEIHTIMRQGELIYIGAVTSQGQKIIEVDLKELTDNLKLVEK